MNDETARALDKALQAAFPDTEQGHPQTTNTMRVADILAHVCDNLSAEGFDCEAYNFHETGRYIDYNFKKNEEDNTCWVSWRRVSLKDLHYMTDVALILNITQWTLADLRGEITSYQKAPDDD